MKVAIYSTHPFEKSYIIAANDTSTPVRQERHELQFIATYLRKDTASLSLGFEAISMFVNDDGTAPVLESLKANGVKFIVLRSAGHNHIDLVAAKKLGLQVAYVPEYSPYSVAEHTVALILALNRKLIRAHSRIMDMNFSLDGLTGFDLHGKTVGIIGTGNIGKVVARIMNGFGCKLLAFDVAPDKKLTEEFNLEFTDMDTLFRNSDIITLHTPLTASTRYLINKQRIEQMKEGVMLINTSRGALIDTKEVIQALKKSKIGYLGLDVYEEEKGLFFEDHSDNILQDDVIARLMTFKNVLITSHQAFLTHEALQDISRTTIHSLDCWAKGTKSEFELF